MVDVPVKWLARRPLDTSIPLYKFLIIRMHEVARRRNTDVRGSKIDLLHIEQID